MKREDLCYRPTLDPAEIDERLSRLLVRGPICDREMERRLVRLDERFRVYAACSPHGLWAPGLVISREMRGTAEVYLPLAEIRRAFHRLFTLSLQFEPFLPASAVESCASWPDVLDHLQPLVREADPGRLLRLLLAEGEFRARFLFSLFLPRHYGSGFGRYRGQAEFLRSWLTARRPKGVVRCLDAACGSGEGSYELALLLLETGYPPERIEVHGSTVEPLELFAAAHGWFPHDPARQTEFRSRTRQLLADGGAGRMVFSQEDLTREVCRAGEGYDVILCNGLLGGPLLSGAGKLTGTVGRLCARLKPGGILLAADRFHGGWKRTASADLLRDMLTGNGLAPVAVADGVAGVKRA